MSKLYSKETLPAEWINMLLTAKKQFDTYNQEKHTFYQCIVLCMDDGEILAYPIFAGSVDELNQNSIKNINFTAKQNSKSIKRILCMWNNYSIDVPSYVFRNRICELNKENKKAVILLSGGTDVYLEKQIAVTM